MPVERRMITTAFGLEIPMPSKVSWLGFAGGWLGVILLIGAFVWIVN